MGLFGWLGSKIKSGYEKAKSGINKAKDWIKEKATNTWNRYSGKKTFDEADELYNRTIERYNSRRRRFDSDVDKYSQSMESYVNAINDHKERIKKELFPKMADRLKKICDVNITDNISFEEFEMKNYSFDEMRAKEKLYKIDFNRHRIKSNILTVFTLGIYTRKKAKETLCAVQEEVKKIDAEISKMEVETKRLEAIEMSLSNVEKYFTDLIEIYENLLVRLDGSVNFLFVRCMSFMHKIVKQEMSIRYLSKIQIKEIEALVTTSKILKVMTEAQIVSLEDKEEVYKYEKTMENQHDEIVKTYMAA